MTTEFPFVPLHVNLTKFIGLPDEGTRIFRAEGSHNEMAAWFDAVTEYVGPCVSPGGASVYAGVTRSGVYKRLKTAGLTAFCFHITGKAKTIFGGEKKLKEHALVYIPVSECQAWKRELEERSVRIEASKSATPEDEQAFDEAYPAKRDNDASFILYDPKDKGKKGMRYNDRPWDHPIPDPNPFGDEKPDDEEDEIL